TTSNSVARPPNFAVKRAPRLSGASYSTPVQPGHQSGMWPGLVRKANTCAIGACTESMSVCATGRMALRAPRPAVAIGGGHRFAHERETLKRRVRHRVRGLAALHASLNDLERLHRMFVVVLGVLLEPPAPLRPDLFILAQAPQGLLGDLLRHPLDGIVGRRDRPSERCVVARRGQELMKDFHV